MVTGFVLTFADKERAFAASERISGTRPIPTGIEIKIGECSVKEIDGWDIIEPFWIGITCEDRKMKELDSWLVQFAGVADDIYVGRERILEFIEYTKPIKLGKPMKITWED